MEHENVVTATFAGGCFWCLEAVFQRLRGVLSVTSGYTGGTKENPTYDEVSDEKTGHAEAIQITFNPDVISYKTLLEIFWISHDPTSLNRQGADVGTVYRSAIFYHSPSQKEEAIASKKAWEKEHIPSIVTEIVAFTKFYKAESYHQNYYNRNAQLNPYCSIVIDPKIQKLIATHNDLLKDEYKS